MPGRRTALLAVTGLFGAAMLLALFTHSTGVVRNDPARNILSPDELTLPLQVQVAYNDRQAFFRYRWPARQPHVVTDVLRYTGGKWQRQLQSPIGSDPSGLAEDRLTMMVDDGSVPEFQRYGGYITVGANMRDFTGSGADAAHRRKYLPATRRDPNDWYSIVDDSTLEAQRRAGYFLDLWHWRAHLSNPLGRADDQNIAWFRLYDSGDTLYFSNWDVEKGQPRWMFDPNAVSRAMRWESLASVPTQDSSPYFLAETAAVPFDANRGWREGDVLPGQVLRESDESRAEIRVQGQGRWADGEWDVTLVRALDTGHPLEDKILRDQAVYSVAFSVHRDARASRWHYVSLPLQIGLGRTADVVATRFAGDVPDWSQVEPREVTLFYPGQVNWPHLTSPLHAGSRYIAKGVPVKYRHKETQLAQYGVEMEFDREIRLQWWLTLVAGVLLIMSFVFSVGLLFRRGED
ncbi:MAG TPA: ethylbenzene dehydrogenase-related protein [Steroidobacteraceae bacterium]|nr:ethylbenzene dehydrogenase-related protein [Steroidobacteraceae bacterium]